MAEKIWFITGASRGFGRIWAEAALARGDKAAATARNPETALNGVTHKALTEALRRLERSGLVSRRVFTTPTLGVEYSITPLGRSPQEPCTALASWVAEHSDAVVQAQQTYDGGQ